jgi:hypothetical protein
MARRWQRDRIGASRFMPPFAVGLLLHHYYSLTSCALALGLLCNSCAAMAAGPRRHHRIDLDQIGWPIARTMP